MEYINLGDICNIKSSKRIYQSEYCEHGIPFYRGKEISQLHRNEELDVELFISRERYQEIKEKYGVVNKGDLLITSVGTIGNTWISDGREFYYKDGNITQIENNYKINTRFLSYLFRSDIIKNQYLRGTSGTAQVALTINKLNKLKIPKIGLSKQNKIVNILDKAQELIDKRKEQIEALDKLVKSKFIEMFGDPVKNPMNWEKRTLNEVSLRKGEYGSGASAIEYIKDYPRYIRITDINDSGKLNNNKVTIENLSEYEKYKLNDGDILFAGYLIRFIPNMDIINPDFLFAFTKTGFYQGWVDAKQNTVAQPNINAKQYGEELEVILPPIGLQNKFADFAKQVDEIKLKMENSLKELEDNFNSLMQKAFKGELF